MEPPNPNNPRGASHAQQAHSHSHSSHHRGVPLRSPPRNNPRHMANAPSSMLRPPSVGGAASPGRIGGTASPYVPLHAEFKPQAMMAAAEEAVSQRAASTQPVIMAGDARDQVIVRQLVSQMGDSMAASLRAVAAQYGVADAVPVMQSALLQGDASAVPEDARLVVQELQKSRRKERELQLLVDDLQTEQRVAKERLALYSILALKLKRELINEKLAHIDSKKEMEELRLAYERGEVVQPPPRSPGQLEELNRQQLQQRGGGGRRGSYESAHGHQSAEEDDPWTSPNKPSSGEATGTPAGTGSGSTLQLSFGSFYSSRRPVSQDGDEDEEDVADEDDERSTEMQSLRNSLMGQFLPSSLLDSPQLTPTARSSSAPRSIDNQDEDKEKDAETKKQEEDQVQEDLERELDVFTLRSPSSARGKDGCDGCGRWRAPVVEVMDCGHRLCRPCNLEVGPVDASTDEPTKAFTAECPRCSQPIKGLRPLTSEDNQTEHTRQDVGASRPSSSDSTATAMSTTVTTTATSAASTPIAPLTLSLLSEMFENIPMEELESLLKDAGGQVSGAIERILQRHPTFNPALAPEVSVTGGPGSGAGGQKASGAPGSLHRSGSSGLVGSQQASQAAGASATAGGSNWKTEMCMYYLQGKCNKTRRTCSFAHGESDLVRTNVVKHTSSTSYKSRMCPLWIEGSCPKSRRECPLAHGENDLRDGLALLGQNAAGPGSASGAGSGPAVPPALPTTAPRLQNYKTELCYYYLKGCCNFTKEECRFAHGESDLRTVESNTLEWSSQLAGSGAPPAKQGFMGDAYANVGGPGTSAAAAADKVSMQQHQFQQQQQYHAQYQPSQQQVMAQHAPFGMPHAAPFVPQAHQYHQMPPQALHPHQIQAQGLPGPQQGPYGVASPGGAHQQQYRYMKSMDDAKPPRRPPPPRREATWSQSSYDSMGPDF